MKKLIIPILIVGLLVLGGCSDKQPASNDGELTGIIQRLDTIEGDIRIIIDRIDTIEVKQLKQNVYKGDKKPSYNVCHKHNDIKIGDKVYFPFLGNRYNVEDNMMIKIDGIKVYYEIQTVVKLLKERVDGKECITMINGYGTAPAKTYEDMINDITEYFKYPY